MSSINNPVTGGAAAAVDENAFLKRKAWGMISSNGNASAIGAIGLFSTSTMTVTDSSSSTLSNADGQFFQQVTNATSGLLAGVNFSNRRQRLDMNGFFHCRFNIFRTTSVRVFIGLCGDVLTGILGSDIPASRNVGLHYSTERGDTNWQWFESESSVITLTDTGIPISDNILIVELDISGDGTSIEAVLMNSARTVLHTATLTTLFSIFGGVAPTYGINNLSNSQNNSIKLFECTYGH